LKKVVITGGSGLMKARYPEVTDIRMPLDNYDTLLSNKKAKKMLNWQPVHHWRSYVQY